MQNHRTRNRAEPTTAEPRPSPEQPAALEQRRALWTPAKQRIFLAALLDTGSVAHGARAAGMSRSSAQRLRVRLAGTPFDRQGGHALAEHARRLADPFGSLCEASWPAPAASRARG